MPDILAESRVASIFALTFALAIASPRDARCLSGGPGGGDPVVDTVRGVLRGRIVGYPDGQPVSGAAVTISAAATARAVAEEECPTAALLTIRTDAQGRFEATLDEGQYCVSASAFGFADDKPLLMHVADGTPTEVTVYLEVVPIRLDEIVVTPSTYGIFKDHVAAAQTLSREEVRVMPRLGDDLFRSVNRLPGVATYDVTAKIHVRGAPSREVLTVLDGLELHEPYHMKDWDGALSIIDVESVSDIDLITGGFSAEYGDKSAGVFAMRSATAPPDRKRTTLGLSLMNLTFESEGGFAGERGAYVVSARRGFLDLLFAITGEDSGLHRFRASEGDAEDTRMMLPGDLHPSYYDAFAKVQYQLTPRHLLSAHLLHAGDHMSGMEEDSTRFDHRYGSSYLWVNWDANLGRRLSAWTVASIGQVSQDRNGGNYVSEPGEADAEKILDVRDEVGFDFLGLKQDWRYEASARVLLKGGLDLRRGSADYDYARWRKEWVPNATDASATPWSLRWDTLNVAAIRSGTEIGAYLAGRVQPFHGLTAEVGIRYDRQAHTGERSLAPRVNVALEVAPRTTLRGAWGHYYQSHGLQELWSADGDTTFYAAQRAEHRVLALEHRLVDGTTLRLEAYQRNVADPLPEYRNLVPLIEGLREEDPEDRVFVDPTRGAARGLELMARSTMTGRFAWSASYALSVAEEEIEGVWVPRPFDQRHALQLQVAYRPNPDWSMSADWVYHSPWPYTSPTYALEPLVGGDHYLAQHFGSINGARLSAYHRMDVRASRRFLLGRGELSVYLDLFNVYNRSNMQAVTYFAAWDAANRRIVTEKDVQDQLGILPTFGLRWVF